MTTAERPANSDVCLAGALLAQHWIKTDQFEDVDRLQTELGRDPTHGVIVDETKMFLPKMEEWKRRAAFLIGRIMRDRFIHFSFQPGGNAGARRVHDEK